jgi:hypothetical protein
MYQTCAKQVPVGARTLSFASWARVLGFSSVEAGVLSTPVPLAELETGVSTLAVVTGSVVPKPGRVVTVGRVSTARLLGMCGNHG